MSIIRKANKNKFTAVSNALISGSGLSFACRGMLVYLLSKPDDWECRVTDLEREGNIGETARRSIMREAEEKGFLSFERTRTADGRFSSTYFVHEEAIPENERTKSWKTRTIKPTPGKPVPGKSTPGQQGAIVITDLLNTDLLNTEENKRDMSTCVDRPSPVEEIFHHWRKTLRHGKAKLTGERKKSISARLKEGYTVEECKRAIDGCALSPFHLGANDRHERYDDITLIFRTGSKLEFFIQKTQPAREDRSQPADANGYGKDANGRGTYNGRLIEI